MNITFCTNPFHLSVRPDCGYSLRPARMNCVSHSNHGLMTSTSFAQSCRKTWHVLNVQFNLFHMLFHLLDVSAVKLRNVSFLINKYSIFYILYSTWTDWLTHESVEGTVVWLKLRRVWLLVLDIVYIFFTYLLNARHFSAEFSRHWYRAAGPTHSLPSSVPISVCLSPCLCVCIYVCVGAWRWHWRRQSVTSRHDVWRHMRPPSLMRYLATSVIIIIIIIRPTIYPVGVGFHWSVVSTMSTVSTNHISHRLIHVSWGSV